MKLINANIKTIGELVKRLVDGEVFHTSESTLKFIPDSVQPFNDITDGSYYYDIDWKYVDFTSLKVEAKWYEDITDPVICWAWDDDHEDKIVAIISGYDSETTYKFTGSYGRFENAEPVKPEDLFQC